MEHPPAARGGEDRPAETDPLGPSPFRDLDRLLGHGRREERELALRVAAAGLAAADPAAAVERLVELRGEDLIVAGEAHRLEPGGRTVLLGAGKATQRIAVALERVLGARLEGGLVAVRDPDPRAPLAWVELVEAAHPIPDRRSLEAATRMLAIAAGLDRDDTALACFSGGSSALASMPPRGVSFTEKRELHRLLLGSGMAIADVNAVRKQVSAFKGGRLAIAAAPARLINLTISDVAGDRLDVLTDPSVPDPSTPQEAIGLLRGQRLWERVPAPIRRHLEGSSGAPDLGQVEIASTLLVNGVVVCEAMAAAARAAGAEPVLVSTALEGDARAVGERIAALAASRSGSGSGSGSGPIVLIACGGEATVRLGADHQPGLGGPNQEAALAAAGGIAELPVAAAFLDTDGSDGGTGAAGALVDGSTAARAAAGGVDLAAALETHRSGAAIAALGDALITGPTHTNVNDLFVVAIV